jgi:CRP-like cAMP-binding protein
MHIAKQTVEPTSSMSGTAIRRPPSPDAFDIVEPFGTTITVRRSNEIYKHDEPAQFCWKMLSGCARSVQLMEDGRRQIGEFLWPGDMLGMNDLQTYYADVEAVTDVTLRRYPRHVVETYANSHVALALRLRMMTLANLRFAHRQILLLGRKTAVERIASFLLAMDSHSATGDGHLVVLPMSRTDIADHLGLSIETVCRNLVILQREGTLAIQRSGVELLDRAALLELACEA